MGFEVELKELEHTSERIVPGKTPYIIYQEHLNRYFFAAQFTKDKIVLDAACGSGYGTAYLLRNGMASRVYGVDISEDAIGYARKKYGHNRISFICADVVNMPFSDNFFDIVVSFETIEHLENHRQYLLECKRVLKRDGLFICSSPNKKIYSPYTKKPLNPYHVVEFFPKQFYAILSESFGDVSLYGQNNVNLIKRVICRIGSELLSQFPKGDSIKHRIRNFVSANKNSYAKKTIVLGGGEMNLVDDNYRVSKFQNSPTTTPTFVIAVAKKTRKQNIE